MATAFIFHGIGGSPEENWFPWLKEQLEADGYSVIVPTFPDPEHPMLAAWSQHMNQYERLIDEDTLYIGHSLGGALALRLLENMQKPIHAAFLVASVWGVMGNEFDPFMTTFTVPPYNWDAIRRSVKHLSIIHSDNDPYITISQAEELARHLDTKVTLVKNGGHFNIRAGYTTFPFLLKEIRAFGVKRI